MDFGARLKRIENRITEIDEFVKDSYDTNEFYVNEFNELDDKIGEVKNDLNSSFVAYDDAISTIKNDLYNLTAAITEIKNFLKINK